MYLHMYKLNKKYYYLRNKLYLRTFERRYIYYLQKNKIKMHNNTERSKGQ